MNKRLSRSMVLAWCAFPPTGRRAGRAAGGRAERPAGGPSGWRVAGGRRVAGGERPAGGGAARAGGSAYTNGLQLGKFWAKGGCDE